MVQNISLPNREILIFVPGPLHHFWSTGVFYLYQLKKSFEIVIVVDEENYRNHKDFQRIIESLNVVEVFYLPKINKIPKLNVIFKNYFYFRNFKELVKKYQPTLLMQHNDNYIENMYLSYWVSKITPNCPRVIFQNARMALDWEADFQHRFAVLYQITKMKFPWLPFYIIIINNRIYKELLSFLEFKILPLLLLGYKFNPKVCVYTGRKYTHNDGFYQKYFYYDKEELVAHLSLFGDKDKQLFHLKPHPVSCLNKNSLTNIFKENMDEQNIILVLPSYGYIEKRILKEGEYRQNIINDVSDAWIRILEILSNTFSDYKIIFKLHPASKNDQIWEDILKNIQMIYDIKILSPEEHAEKWIVKSKVIIGDMSSALWWASLFGQKKVISCDLFNYDNADEAKYYSNINYVNSFEQLENLNL